MGRAEKDLDKTTATVHQPDRRPGQAQRRRAAGGLVTAQQPTAVAAPDPARHEPPPNEDVPRRAATCPPPSPSAPRSGFGVIAILLFAPYVWIARGGGGHGASPPTRWCGGCATAGYAIPVIPLLVGGQAMVWLTWPFGPAGALGGFGGTVVVCMIWRLLSGGLKDAPVNYLRDISTTVLPGRLDTAVRRVRRAAGLSRRRRRAGALPDARRRVLRHRRLRRGRAVRQASDGAGDQSRRSPGRASRARWSAAPPPRCWP